MSHSYNSSEETEESEEIEESEDTEESEETDESDSDISPSATSNAITVDSESIDSLFHSYANGSTGLIDPEGIEKLCADIEVDHTDVRILMLAWKMNAGAQGFFTLDEWRRGLKALDSDTISKLKQTLQVLENEVWEPRIFADFYSFAFKYCLTEKQKNIDIQTSCQLLNLVLGTTFPAQVDLFVEYLNTQTDYKVISLDQWMGFFRFCNEINFPSLDNYDPEFSWPLILDYFVEWIQAKQN